MSHVEFVQPDLGAYDALARRVVSILIRGRRDNLAKSWGRLCRFVPEWRLKNALQFATGRVPEAAATFFGLSEYASYSHVLDKVETAVAASAKPRW